MGHIRTERLAEIDRVAGNVELSLTEVLQRIDEELGRQRAVTLQGVERLASALILPHPERETWT